MNIMTKVTLYKGGECVSISNLTLTFEKYPTTWKPSSSKMVMI